MPGNGAATGTARGSAASPRGKTRPRVLLVDMPFSDLPRPSFPLGLLKAIGLRAGFPVDVVPLKLHFAVRFAELHAYTRVARKFSLGFGEWIFSEAAFGKFSPRDAREPTYESFLRGQGVPEKTIRELCDLRALVPGFLKYCQSAVDWERFDLVGFTTTHCELTPALALAKRVKEWSPGTRIVIGGAKCEGGMGAQIFSAFEEVDFVFSGEADQSFPALLEDIASGAKNAIAGVLRRDVEPAETATDDQPPTDPNSLPTPDYSEYFLALRRLGAQELIPPALTVEGSRGCWWGEKSLCTFCGLNGRMIDYRRKDPERLVAEVSELVEKHRVFRLHLTDNIIDPDFFVTFFPRLAELGLTLDIFVEIKANLKRSELETLLKAGVRSLQPGIENVDPHILKLMHKGISGLHNVQVLKWGAELGMSMEWNILLNFPGETDADYENLLGILQAITHLQPPCDFGRIRVDRFSPNFREAARGSPEWGDADELSYPGAQLRLFQGGDSNGNPGIRITGPSEYYRHAFDLDEAALRKLAYSFEYTIQGEQPDPQLYERIVEFVTEWQKQFKPQKLVYFKGPRSLRIDDQRFNLHPRTILLDEREREIYLAAEEITTPERLVRHLERQKGWTDISVAQVKRFLDSLVEESLLLREGNRYLALAVPWNPAHANYREFGQNGG